jgi:hypothetical protein
VLDTVSHTVSAAIRFGLTADYLRLAVHSFCVLR